MTEFLGYLLAHKGTVLFIGAMVGTSVTSTMPSPDAPFTWRTLYTWFYEAVHLFIGLRRQQALPSTEKL